MADRNSTQPHLYTHYTSSSSLFIRVSLVCWLRQGAALAFAFTQLLQRFALLCSVTEQQQQQLLRHRFSSHFLIFSSSVDYPNTHTHQTRPDHHQTPRSLLLLLSLIFFFSPSFLYFFVPFFHSLSLSLALLFPLSHWCAVFLVFLICN